MSVPFLATFNYLEVFYLEAVYRARQIPLRLLKTNNRGKGFTFPHRIYFYYGFGCFKPCNPEGVFLAILFNGTFFAPTIDHM